MDAFPSAACGCCPAAALLGTYRTLTSAPLSATLPLWPLLRFSFFTGFQHSNGMCLGCGFLCIYPIHGFLGSLICEFTVFINEENFVHVVSATLPFLGLKPHVCQTGAGSPPGPGGTQLCSALPLPGLHFTKCLLFWPHIC